MTTETKKCRIFVKYSDGDSLLTWMNPACSNDEIRNHYLGNTFTRGGSDAEGNWFERKVKAISVMIVRFADDIETNAIASADRYTLANYN